MSAPNLYQHFRLETSATCAQLGSELSRRDEVWGQRGYPADSSLRRQTVIAYAILGDATLRATYDTALGNGRQMSWEDLMSLVEEGAWPAQPGAAVMETVEIPATFASAPLASAPLASAPLPTGSPASAPLATGGLAAAPLATPTVAVEPPVEAPTPLPPVAAPAPAAVITSAPAFDYRRTVVGRRVVAGAIDMVIVGVLSTILVAVEPGSGFRQFLMSMLIAAIFALYFIVCEYAFGATPGKALMGLTLRDSTTGANLGFMQAVKRNIPKLVGVIPFIGPVLVIPALATVFTATNEKQRLALADRYAGAEVLHRYLIN